MFSNEKEQKIFKVEREKKKLVRGRKCKRVSECLSVRERGREEGGWPNKNERQKKREMGSWKKKKV
jgi:hypothetical protein